ncbi:nuclease [Hyphomonas sp.]|uniref:nuclease n=1 Tax=Hyphomonas sp. TaxID=87 RepID=UPI00391BF66E
MTESAVNAYRTRPACRRAGLWAGLWMLGACASPGAAAQGLPMVRDCAPGGFVGFPETVWTAEATAVIDGDSFCLGEAEIRLRRFNAPEWDEPGGPEARAVLAQILAARGPVTCEAKARHGDRVIAACTLADGESLDDALRNAETPRDGP